MRNSVQEFPAYAPFKKPFAMLLTAIIFLFCFFGVAIAASDGNARQIRDLQRQINVLRQQHAEDVRERTEEASEVVTLRQRLVTLMQAFEEIHPAVIFLQGEVTTLTEDGRDSSNALHALLVHVNRLGVRLGKVNVQVVNASRPPPVGQVTASDGTMRGPDGVVHIVPGLSPGYTQRIQPPQIRPIWPRQTP